MTGEDTSFPAALDRWTDADWSDFRERVEDGEGSCAAIDAVNRRLRRTAQKQTGARAEASQ
ncbi:hypothetical protein [Streptomyces sp. WM6378]|uniref:hypothetical protein n=1 Tax=Streptomyces sp. WM6378 TaxID=1415557 RepID=UPI0006B02ED3|nr:hypothetical protein [Streptomyces sp. WM6378]KOU39902.1 hypothetical protein ADK54_24500 [Streptomyces sp. WM6378]